MAVCKFCKVSAIWLGSGGVIIKSSPRAFLWFLICILSATIKALNSNDTLRKPSAAALIENWLYNSTASDSPCINILRASFTLSKIYT